MNKTDGRLKGVDKAHSRQILSVMDDVDASLIRARVRAMLKSHGRLLGETWDAQAHHAEQAVSEVIEIQGLEAGLRWAMALDGQLKAEREASGVANPASDATYSVVDARYEAQRAE
jgi:hypothetical protein